MGTNIVITGAEIVTCLGTSRQETWEQVVQGRCGMRTLSALESPLAPDKLGGQALDLPADYHPDAPREVRYLRWTIEHALAEAGALDSLPYPPERCGFMLGTTLHGMRAGGQYLRTGDHAPLGKFLAGSTLDLAVAGLLPTGFAATTCSACSSSLGSIALGATLLQTGQLDMVICGGYDTISEYAYGGFNSLRLVAEGPLRPFSKERQGMKLGEGYGIVILERADAASARGATALAQVLGWGESADAHHLTQPHPQGDGAARAMTMAISRAGVTPNQIGLVAAHATGTPDNDAAEFAAMSRVFGDNLPNVPVVGFKSHLGHTLGGAGAVEMILAMTAMREATVPPCASVGPADVEFPTLRLSTGSATKSDIRATLSTSLGFGGANTCVVLGPPPQAAPLAVHAGNIEKLRDVLITGIGVVVPGGIGNDAFLARLSPSSPDAWSHDTGDIAEEQYVHLLNARRIRRMSDQVKLTLAATAIACQHAGITDVTAFANECSAILGSAHGSANYSVAYYGEIIKQGLVGANPMLFAEGVPNASSAHLSLMLGVKGACQTIIGTRTAALDALRLASLRIASGAWERAVVGASEEHSDIINDAYRHCGLYTSEGNAPFASEAGFVTGAASVSFILESRDAVEARGGRAYGVVLEGASARSQPGDPTAAARQVLSQLHAPRHVITSANGTRVDRTELAALRLACPGATVSSMYGHVAESFSVTPLLGIAATLLSGRLPALRGGAIDRTTGLAAATGAETPDSVVALCSDYTGHVSALRVGLNPSQNL
jgi:3-oxoacyl-[acyl-carrier-protein] synthase II